MESVLAGATAVMGVAFVGAFAASVATKKDSEINVPDPEKQRITPALIGPVPIPAPPTPEKEEREKKKETETKETVEKNNKTLVLCRTDDKKIQTAFDAVRNVLDTSRVTYLQTFNKQIVKDDEFIYDKDLSDIKSDPSQKADEYEQVFDYVVGVCKSNIDYNRNVSKNLAKMLVDGGKFLLVLNNVNQEKSKQIIGVFTEEFQWDDQVDTATAASNTYYLYQMKKKDASDVGDQTPQTRLPYPPILVCDKKRMDKFDDFKDIQIPKNRTFTDMKNIPVGTERTDHFFYMCQGINTENAKAISKLLSDTGEVIVFLSKKVGNQAPTDSPDVFKPLVDEGFQMVANSRITGKQYSLRKRGGDMIPYAYTYMRRDQIDPPQVPPTPEETLHEFVNQRAGDIQIAIYAYVVRGGEKRFVLVRKIRHEGRVDASSGTKKGAAGTASKFFGRWTSPGGKANDPNRSILQNAVEELNDETGLLADKAFDPDQDVEILNPDPASPKKLVLKHAAFMAGNNKTALVVFEITEDDEALFPSWEILRQSVDIVNSSKGEIDCVTSMTATGIKETTNDPTKPGFFTWYSVSTLKGAVIPVIEGLKDDPDLEASAFGQVNNDEPNGRTPADGEGMDVTYTILSDRTHEQTPPS
nr:hypothetical protein TetV2_00296 [Oceanusvirus sp.]